MKAGFAILSLVIAFLPGMHVQEKPSGTSSKANSATIVFFREHHYNGWALKPSVYVDEKDEGRLPNGEWFSLSVEPGDHKLRSSMKHEPDTIVKINPGETVYVQMVILAGTWRGGGELAEADASQAKEEIAKLHERK
ncbi:MAG TPA: DUF2846 domain-containing protein [Candidatus Acidoferrales bacterium]|nr:DUF2846 domain-containing protein [Candidatus Acidoferrales bacterium]